MDTPRAETQEGAGVLLRGAGVAQKPQARAVCEGFQPVPEREAHLTCGTLVRSLVPGAPLKHVSPWEAEGQEGLPRRPVARSPCHPTLRLPSWTPPPPRDTASSGAHRLRGGLWREVQSRASSRGSEVCVKLTAGGATAGPVGRGAAL